MFSSICSNVENSTPLLFVSIHTLMVYDVLQDNKCIKLIFIAITASLVTK